MTWPHGCDSTGLALFDGFTRRYGVKMLVWFEPHATREAAFLRERQIKKWKRAWKLQLIEASNPAWIDRVAETPFLN
jgi:putative endonuclease